MKKQWFVSTAASITTALTLTTIRMAYSPFQAGHQQNGSHVFEWESPFFVDTYSTNELQNLKKHYMAVKSAWYRQSL